MKKVFGLCLVAILTITMLGASFQSQAVDNVVERVQSLTMFKASKFSEHLRMARDEDIERILEEQSILLPGASLQQRQMAVQEFKTQFIDRNPTTPNPLKLQALLEKERGVALMAAAQAEAVEPQIKSLVVPVEFPGNDTFDFCGSQVTTTGPLHNEIAPPGPRDNNTIWYEDTSPDLYDELYFGVGPKAGVIVHHPNLGKVDLRGNTMANYYLEQSEGKFVPQGAVYPKWLTALHSEGWYGADSCDGGSHNVRAQELIPEVVDQINIDDPSFAWEDFDADGDGIVDNFTVIHAGQGQEAGGGAQGDFSIWSHASLINWPSGYLACAVGSDGCPDRDIYVREYSMDPENIDVGVISEEFGHAAFGLPDLYTTDYDSSIGNWAIMEAGSWNGKLGGMQPAPFPLWFRTLIGWADPVQYDYTTEPVMVKVGQLSQRPKRTESGIRINLPDQEITVPNPLGTGQAWWSGAADLANYTLEHEFDLTGTAAPIFSFASAWSIETDWDGGYIEISTDGGATWIALPDLDGYLVQTTLNGNNPDQNWVLTGEGTGILRFDLTAYAGQVVRLRLRYASDLAVQFDGWWADDFALTDGGASLFSDDVENPPGAWVTDSWQIVPLTNIYPRYYLVEWRNNSGFDRGLKYPYQTVYYDEDEWQVDRAPFTVPGALLYFRDAAYSFDYTLADSWYDPPSYGPKHGLIVVDSHSFPYMWDNYTYASGQNIRISRRIQTADATFTLQKTTPFTIRLGYDPATGQYLDEPLETKTFGPRQGINQFHDSIGYYPGLWYNENDGGLYFWDVAASAVVPATGNYTTKITWPDNTPAYELYGADLGDTVLGSGNPGDSGVQFGLHMAVVDKDREGKWGLIKLWNSPSVLELTNKVYPTVVKPGHVLTYTVKIVNTTPVFQSFELNNPIPENTTFFKGWFYDRQSKSIHWKGMIAPYGTQYLIFAVKVNKGVPKGTVITNQAYLTDGALGASASAEATVK
jgi:immune inhibitor A